MLNLLKKNSLEKINYSRSSPDPESISSHIISFRFLPISGHFWKIGRFEAGKLAVTEENFFWLSQKEKFLEPIENNPYFVLITSEPVSATISIALFWWSRRFIYFFLILLQLLIMQSQPALIAWTGTSAAFYHCWSYTEHSVLWIRCVVYIWY